MTRSNSRSRSLSVHAPRKRLHVGAFVAACAGAPARMHACVRAGADVLHAVRASAASRRGEQQGWQQECATQKRLQIT
eukprot:5132163-Pleurochrysis_carterae.AAC.1